MSEFFPEKDADVLQWHTNFKAECAKNSEALASALPPDALKQIEINQATIEFLLQVQAAVKNYAAEVNAWKESVVRGTAFGPVPAAPQGLTIPAMDAHARTGIVLFTDHIAKQIKAHPNYSEAIGEAMGIETGGIAANMPSITADPLSQSMVELVINMATHKMIAVERRRNGDWELIGESAIVSFLDNDWPMVDGQPEQREYRVQGVENGERTGPMSEVVSVMTRP